MRHDGDQIWRHDDECSLRNPCAACAAEEEARGVPLLPPTYYRYQTLGQLPRRRGLWVDALALVATAIAVAMVCTLVYLALP